MSRYAIGDIHGCWDALEALLEQVPLHEDDQLVLLGDYIDRGPDSAKVLNWVIDQVENQGTIALRGNHEVMMLAALQGEMRLEHWLGCGGQEALESYLPKNSKRSPSPDWVPQEHLNFLKHRLRPYFETESHIFVHASLYSELPLDEQDEHTFYWERFDDIAPHCSGKQVICGHTAQKSGRPAVKDHAICIDTWVYGNGWLTCLDVESGRYWQANQKRKQRHDWL